MDERKQELGELRDYGHKLLEKLRYPDVISMLQQTITHISGIAEEYSNEADKWHEKYDECFAQNEKLQGQIEDLSAAAERQNQELCDVIDTQARKIENMSADFAKQMEELRSYRNQEINSHGEKVQALVATQAVLDKMSCEVEETKRKLDDEISQYEAEKAEYENKRKEYEDKIEVNQAKLDEYQTLFDYKLNAEARIAEVQKATDDKDIEAKEAIEALTKQYNDEKTLREKLEAELIELKKQHGSNANAPEGETPNSQGDSSEGQNEHSSNDDDDDDSTR